MPASQIFTKLLLVNNSKHRYVNYEPFYYRSSLDDLKVFKSADDFLIDNVVLGEA
jgi:hypothetical protein